VVRCATEDPHTTFPDAVLSAVSGPALTQVHGFSAFLPSYRSSESVDKYRARECSMSTVSTLLYAICKRKIQILNEKDSGTQGLTRRELLKRGAAIGGALVWATPVVQLIGMQPALAAHVSELCICAKFNGCTDGGDWQVLGTENPGNCLTSTDHGVDCDRQFPPDQTFKPVDNAGQCGLDEFCVQFDGLDVTIYFPSYCTLTAVAEKRGAGKGGDPCIFHLSAGSETSPFMFTVTSECSHLEFCFQC